MTVKKIIQQQAQQNPNAIAIAAPGREPLTYSRLNDQINQVVAQLNAMGIGRNDRVGIILPNGPELAVTFLAVASGATSAPLNPAYQTKDFDFYLSDLEAKAIITQTGIPSPSREVARSRGIPIIELMPLQEEAAGIFTLNDHFTPSNKPVPFAEPEDIALVLHTSGTTSRPKMVPLSHINLCASADHIKQTLQLSSQDRCLNVMPLFHIHGIMAAILSSMNAGASVVCTEGFAAANFFSWIDAFSPTWYTAVPTMHQAVLEQASLHQSVIQQNPLRFIRSSSSSLPPQVMRALEDVFQAPVIESYGMTEAAHQMASNPLPPGERRPGSVGPAAGPEIAIMNEEGILLKPTEIGEIVIKGPNVTKGYANNPDANKKAFTNGWFRTGDQGYLDDTGYLYITGRIKEIINRGGEKIAPREIDEALLDHPAVIQAVAFAVPHARLGEDVVAAVILEDRSEVTEEELRKLTFSKLANFKVPSKILVVDKIPKGPTGKLQRIGLAAKLADQLESAFEAPNSPTEVKLAAIWKELLELEKVGRDDNFFMLGGESLVAAIIIAEVRKSFHLELSLQTLFEFPTLAGLAGHIDTLKKKPLQKDSQPIGNWTSLLPVQSGGDKQPFFLVPGGIGGESELMIYANLFYFLGRDQPIYGFRMRGLDGRQAPHTSVEAMAKDYIQEIRSVQPEGPYLIGGECSGGIVAYEMAQQLQQQGQEVHLLIMNTQRPDQVTTSRRKTQRIIQLLHLNNISYHWYNISKLGFKEGLKYIFGVIQGVPAVLFSSFKSSPQQQQMKQIQQDYSQIIHSYQPKPYSGPTTVLVSEDYYAKRPTLGWGELAAGPFRNQKLAGNSHAYLRDHVQSNAAIVKEWLDQAVKSS